MSKQRCQQETTATEFYKWRIIFKEEDERIEATTCREHVQERYLAQIAMYIVKTHTNDPSQIKLESFLIRGKKKPKSITPEEKAKSVSRVKAYWRQFILASSSVKRKPKKRT